MTIFVYRNGEQHGPYTLAQIQGLVAQGHLQTSDYARTETMTDWKRVEELLRTPEFTATPPPPALVPVSNAPLVSAAISVPMPASAAPLPAAAISIPAPVPVVAVPATPAPAGNFLTWPFHQKGWVPSLLVITLLFWLPLSLFAVPLFWIPFFWWIPLAGVLASLGWVMEATRRRGRKDVRLLPQARHAGRMFLEGFVLGLMWLGYFVIPLILMKAWAAEEWDARIQELIQWVFNVILSRPHEAFSDITGRMASLYVTEHVGPLILVALAIPLFAAAEVRYALTKHLWSFFNVPGNALLLLTHLGGFLRLAFFSLMALIAGIALVAVLPFMAIPATAAFLWVVAYLQGGLAMQICEKGRLKAAAEA